MLTIEQILDQLDEWRHLPSYQLERRADIFFSFYMKEVVEKLYGKGNDFSKTIIPELPVGRLDDKKGTQNISVKVDYALYSEKLKLIVFVELKTDEASIKKDQIDYLVQAKKDGLKKQVERILRNFWDGDDKRKYFHLLKALKTWGLFNFPEGVEGLMEKTSLSGLSGLRQEQKEDDIKKLENLNIELLLVKPCAERPDSVPKEMKILGFKELAKYVRHSKMNASQRFADSLIEWVDTRAGWHPNKSQCEKYKKKEK